MMFRADIYFPLVFCGVVIFVYLIDIYVKNPVFTCSLALLNGFFSYYFILK